MGFGTTFLFLILFLILWSFSIIFLYTDRVSESSRWLSAFAFLAGCGGFSVVLDGMFIPYMKENFNSHFPTIDGILSSFAHYLGPYAILMYGITYSNLFGNRWEYWRYKLTFVLLIPAILSYIYFLFIPNSFRRIPFLHHGQRVIFLQPIFF